MQFYACSCYFTHQIFLQSLRLHVKYLDRSKFLTDYQELLRTCHHVEDEGKMAAIISEIETEVDRRKRRDEEFIQRRDIIAQHYKPLHPAIWKLKEDILMSEFTRLVELCRDRDHGNRDIVIQQLKQEGEELYSLPVFTAEFCQQLIEELKHFEATDLPKGRPNTMNNSGVLLDELGLYDDFITPLRQNYLEPLCRLLYPDWSGESLDSHKAFIVKYSTSPGGDLDLNYHYDNSEVTINICLGQEFKDGGLYLGPMRGEMGTRFTEYRHVIGRGLLHRGQQQHGAEPISDGERYNLIVWLRASSVRNKLCPMCDETPCLVESQGYGDGFTRTQSSGWCANS